MKNNKIKLELERIDEIEKKLDWEIDERKKEKKIFAEHKRVLKIEQGKLDEKYKRKQ